MLSRAQKNQFYRACGIERGISPRLDNSQRGMARRSHPVGFYYLILSGIILGLFAGCVIVGLVFASNWVSEALHYDAQTGAIATLFVTLGIAVFLVWLIHDPLRRRKLGI